MTAVCRSFLVVSGVRRPLVVLDVRRAVSRLVVAIPDPPHLTPCASRLHPRTINPGPEITPGQKSGAGDRTTCLCNGLYGGSEAWTAQKASAPLSNLLAPHRATLWIWSSLAESDGGRHPPHTTADESSLGPVDRVGRHPDKSLQHIPPGGTLTA